jgi:hypothetical protein
VITASIPGDVPNTGGMPMSLLFGFGLIVAITGCVLAALPHRKRE